MPQLTINSARLNRTLDALGHIGDSQTKGSQDIMTLCHYDSVEVTHD